MTDRKRHTYQINQVRLPLGEPLESIYPEVARLLGCAEGDWHEIEVLKRSLDARGRRHPAYDLCLGVVMPAPLSRLGHGVSVYREDQRRAKHPLPEPSASLRDERIVVVGAGPCGLFAALTLVERGIRCTVLDRGEAVEARAKSVSRLMGKGLLNPESNLCFGEGGAGTWSDGKLYTRIGGDDAAWVLERMVDLGAPREILVDRRPHLGTDRLVRLLKGIRRHLEANGVTIRFEARVERIREADTAAGAGRRPGLIELEGGERLEADRVVLAIGHSARDLYRTLLSAGVAMEPKTFAVGFRVEHPQQLINEIQFGDCARTLDVPAAEYRLTFNRRGNRKGSRQASKRASREGGRKRRESSQARDDKEQVYSFCMCPGGSVVPTASRPGEVCVNGMSHAARSGHYANSALVTPLLAGELPSGVEPVLAGVAYQESMERLAFDLGGGDFAAPAVRLVDYLAGKVSSDVRRTTYRRGVQPADLERCYAPSVHERLRAAIATFDRRMRGFISEEAVLIGVETRTSAPLRILRDERGRSVSHPFLYPGGEGAGYAGGITSSAVDGIRIARWILGGD